MILQTENLSKLYKNNRGAQEISLSIAPGEILGLLGPNGSGKTTVMKAVMGLLHPTAGRVLIEGHDVHRETEKALASVGALIEAPSLFDRMTARQNLELAAAYYRDIPADRISEVLAMVDMSRYENERVGGFSLGMRQRIGLALALVNKPRLLIWDEPANGLDIEGMVMIREIVKACAAGGSAVMISSHLAHEIELCATHVAIMHDGRQINLVGMEQALSAAPSLEEFYLAEVTRFRRGGVVA